MQGVKVDDANKRMWHQGYEMSESSPQSSTSGNIQNVLEAQKSAMEEKMGKDYIIVVCQKKKKKKCISTIP